MTTTDGTSVQVWLAARFSAPLSLPPEIEMSVSRRNPRPLVFAGAAGRRSLDVAELMRRSVAAAESLVASEVGHGDAVVLHACHRVESRWHSWRASPDAGTPVVRIARVE